MISTVCVFHEHTGRIITYQALVASYTGSIAGNLYRSETFSKTAGPPKLYATLRIPDFVDTNIKEVLHLSTQHPPLRTKNVAHYQTIGSTHRHLHLSCSISMILQDQKSRLSYSIPLHPPFLQLKISRLIKSHRWRLDIAVWKIVTGEP